MVLDERNSFRMFSEAQQCGKSKKKISSLTELIEVIVIAAWDVNNWLIVIWSASFQQADVGVLKINTAVALNLILGLHKLNFQAIGDL